LYNVLHKGLRLHTYKLQFFQRIKEEDKVLRFHFATFVLNWLSEDTCYQKEIVFMNKATFHISGGGKQAQLLHMGN
jgi:hypothetical protein